jgi:hypothetical protein
VIQTSQIGNNCHRDVIDPIDTPFFSLNFNDLASFFPGPEAGASRLETIRED